MKVAIVHDYLREYGGAERVVEVLHEIWPDAPLYTSFVDFKSMDKQGERFKDYDIRTSSVGNNWIIKKFHSPLRFLAPLIWNSLDLSKFDLVVSSSGWFMCRGVNIGRKKLALGLIDKVPLHICYIHHPPRNLYGYATGSSLQKYKIVRIYASIVNFFLRHYDYDTAQRVDHFIANSIETKRRVEKFYRRDSAVIYPPIDVKNIKLEKNQKRDYFLAVGRLSYSKRNDLIIEACNKLKLPLKIAGVGGELSRLKEIAGNTIEFLGSVSDVELAKLYGGAKALIFSALDEDFGMVPVEAMAYGTPVIALRQGGVKETVMEGKTGEFFDNSNVESLVEAINKFNKGYKPDKYTNNCLKQAERFSKPRFKNEIIKFVNEKMKK